jgi:phosphoenolpyruvate carboxylase
MYQEWPFFNTIIANCEMTLAKSDMHIMSHYASLVADQSLREEIVSNLTREHERTVSLLLEVTEQSDLLERNPVLRDTLFIRRHYLDPLSYLQVDLLKRYRDPNDRDDKDALLKAIQLSINGIASGMKNTG